MTQYYGRMTPQEVRKVIAELERSVRAKRRAKSYAPVDWIVFAPKQVIETLRVENAEMRKGGAFVELLGDTFLAREGALPNILRKYNYLGRQFTG
ncbi:MAG: hypothetical protein WBA46_01770 [Thermomicrobiales bacterium]